MLFCVIGRMPYDMPGCSSVVFRLLIIECWPMWKAYHPKDIVSSKKWAVAQAALCGEQLQMNWRRSIFSTLTDNSYLRWISSERVLHDCLCLDVSLSSPGTWWRRSDHATWVTQCATTCWRYGSALFSHVISLVHKIDACFVLIYSSLLRKKWASIPKPTTLCGRTLQRQSWTLQSCTAFRLACYSVSDA